MNEASIAERLKVCPAFLVGVVTERSDVRKPAFTYGHSIEYPAVALGTSEGILQKICAISLEGGSGKTESIQVFFE